MESARCVICYDRKAYKFCVDCKTSSGVCGDCYITMNKQRYDGHQEGSGDYAEPISCVICKSDMNQAALITVFDMDLEEYGETLFPDSMSKEKKDKLLTIMGHPIPKYDSDSE